MLNNNTSNEKLLRDERQGKMLLHTEFSLLSLLKHEKGVIQQHELFSVSGIFDSPDLIAQSVDTIKKNLFLYFFDMLIDLCQLFHRIWRMKKYYLKMAVITIFTRDHYEND